MKKIMSLLLLLAFAPQAQAIEAYSAQDIQPYQAPTIKPVAPAKKPNRPRAQTVKPYTAAEVKPYQAQEIQPYQSQDIEPHQAQEVKPYQAQDIQPSYSQDVQPSYAQDVQPHRGGEVAPGTAVNIEQIRTAPAAPTPAPTPSVDAGKKAAAKGAKALVGTWQTNIPGAIYTTPSGQPGYDILHVSSGASAGLLRIKADGTYSWNSYGGKKGRWVQTSDAEYPLEIVDTVENRRWKVGYSAAKGVLFIWSGSIWYEGRRAEVKKK